MLLFGTREPWQLEKNRDVKRLVGGLRSRKDGRYRAGCAEALGRVGDGSAVEPLIGAIEDPNPFVSSTSIVSLGALRDLRAVEPLLGALRYPSPVARRNRAEIVKALGEIGDARALGALVSALTDPQQQVREAAAHALDRLRWKPDRESAGAAYWAALGDWDACVEIGAPAVPIIVALLEADASRPSPAETLDVPAARLGAVKVLGAIGGSSAVNALIETLHDPDRWVRGAAVEQLATIGGSRAVEPLITALHDDATWEGRAARTSIVQALDRLADERALEPLAAVLAADEDDVVRSSAARALCRFQNPRATESLVRALKDPVDHVRESAVEALGKAGGTRSVEPLVAALKDTSAEVRLAAARVLGEIGDARAVAPLRAAIDDAARSARTWNEIASDKVGEGVDERDASEEADNFETLAGVAAEALRKLDRVVAAAGDRRS